MTEAVLFYETAHASLRDDFFDDIQYAIDTITPNKVRACGGP